MIRSFSLSIYCTHLWWLNVFIIIMVIIIIYEHTAKAGSAYKNQNKTKEKENVKERYERITRLVVHLDAEGGERERGTRERVQYWHKREEGIHRRFPEATDR